MNNTTVASSIDDIEPFIIVCNIIIGFILLAGCVLFMIWIFIHLRIIGKICDSCINCKCCDDVNDNEIQIIVLPRNKVMNCV